jgi:aspartate/methionine/tyrosine aminotransferase
MPTLPDFRLEAHFSKWEFTARYQMASSDVQSMSLGDLLALGSADDRAAFENAWLGYTQTFGSPALRETIASTYERITAASVLCFAGAEEGLYIAMHALLTAADHAIVVTPNYQAAESVPLSLCAVSGIALDARGGWSLDIDQVSAAIRPNTKLISINFPHNPTGKVLERDRFDALIALCREHGLWLFSDEVYAGIGAGHGQQRLPQAADVYERGLSLNVMSKAYGLAGLRIGWIACRDSALLLRMERIKHYLSICNSAPSEHLAIIALKARSTILPRVHTLLATNLGKLHAFFCEYPHLFEWYRPDGGCVAYPRYLGTEGIETFAAALVERSGVLVLPASLFRSELTATPTDRFRIGYGRADIDAGLAALRAHLEQPLGGAPFRARAADFGV